MQDCLGTRIRRLRQDRHWSQQELSMRAGISTPHISSIERNKRQPSLEYAKRMADALGVPLTALSDDSKDLRTPKLKRSPEEWPLSMQNFILNEEAEPYLEAAQQLSNLPKQESDFVSLIIELLTQKYKYNSRSM